MHMQHDAGRTHGAYRTRGGRAGTTLCAALLLACAALLPSPARAADFVLDVVLHGDRRARSADQLRAASGAEAEFRIAGDLRLAIVPTLQSDGRVYLVVRALQTIGAAEVPVAEQRLLTRDASQTPVRIASANGTAYRLTITPRLQ